MHPSWFLLATVVFAVPSRALLDLTSKIRDDQSLVALNALQTPGLEFGHFFDAAAHQSMYMTQAAVVALPPKIPFMVRVPAEPSPAYQRAFRRLMAKPEQHDYDAEVQKQAEEQKLDPRLVKAVIGAESEFSARAVSPSGAMGLMQVKPATAQDMGVAGAALFDPVANIRAGTRYLAYLFTRAWKRYRLEGADFTAAPAWLVQRVIAAYNSGPRWIAQRPLLRRTRAYVRRVMLFYGSEVSAFRKMDA